MMITVTLTETQTTALIHLLDGRHECVVGNRALANANQRLHDAYQRRFGQLNNKEKQH